MGTEAEIVRSSQQRRRKADIDGGWAWVILITSFMSLFLTCGALYSVSIFNVIFLEHFNESKAMTSLVGSILIGLIALMGPVSSILSNRFGWRVPMVLGGLIATIGTYAASMAQTITQILLSYGVVAGIGLGLAYTPAIVVVGYYFEKYRTVASGIASVGAGVGMMAFPPLIRFLGEYYSWREILGYISCLYAHLCVFGALMRPLPNDIYVESINQAMQQNVTANPEDKEPSETCESPEKNELSTKYDPALASTSTTIADHYKLSVDVVLDSYDDTNNNINEMIDSNLQDRSETPIIPEPELNDSSQMTIIPEPELNDSSHTPIIPEPELNKEQNQYSPSLGSHEQTFKEKAYLFHNSCSKLDDLQVTHVPNPALLSPNGLTVPHSLIQSKPLLLCSNGLNAAHSLIQLEQISRNNSSTNLRKLDKRKSPSVKSITSLPYGVDTANNTSGDKNKCFCTKVGLYFGTCCKYSCSCAKNKTNIVSRFNIPSILTGEFIIFCASIFMFGIGLSALYLHLSAFAIASGASETEASFLITLLGISSIISRVFTGIAGNDNSIDNTILYIGAFGIAGISTMLCPSFGGTAKGRMFYALSFGFYGSCFNVLLAPLTVELIGLKNLSTAFGIEMVVNGVAYFIGPPLAGLLYDITGRYDTSFFLAGVCLISSAVVMMLVSVFRRNELPMSMKDRNISKALVASS